MSTYKPLDVGESVAVPPGDLMDWMARLLVHVAREAGGTLRVPMATLRAYEMRAHLAADHDKQEVVVTVVPR